MQKIFCFIILLFLTSGCEVTYELDIDGEDFNETTTIIENDSNVLNSYFNDITYQDLFDVYINKPIPVFKNYEIQPDSDEEIEGVRYYDKKDLTNDNQTGFSLSTSFSADGLQNSTVINNNYNRFIKATIDDHIVLSTGETLSAFEQYTTLDEVTIKITTNHEVIEHNADEVEDGTYIWHVTRDNYTDKEVYFEIEEDVTQEEESEGWFQNMWIALLIIGGIVVLMAIIFIFITIKQKLNNRL